MSEIQSADKHRLNMSGRRSLRVEGTTDVVSFDDTSIVLSTVCGILSVDGEGLRIVSLDTDKGITEIEGSISGMIYPEGAAKGGFFRRKQR